MIIGRSQIKRFTTAIDSSLELLITVVLTFYLLVHGESFWSGIWQWLPQYFSFRDLGI
ncbi:MAG: hypothetical protein HC764_18565 [Pleurocapsa sp. CRU_1_2]|nr:hypothetical protein [Pleurocapsa sp. CRU_1_2]